MKKLSKFENAVLFAKLESEWKKETIYLSLTRDIVMNYAYQRIIGMGPAAVPLIMRSMRKNPAHWFWALESITGQNPVKHSHRGNIKKMTEDWLEWYKKEEQD